MPIKIKTPVKYSSATYVVLCYLRMKRCPVSVDDYRKFAMNRVRPSDIIRAFDVLLRYGFAVQCPNRCVQITKNGIDYLMKIAQKDNRSEDYAVIR